MNNFIHEDWIADLNICDELIEWFYSKEKEHLSGCDVGNDSNPVDHTRKKSTDYCFSFRGETEPVVVSYSEELQIFLHRYISAYGFADRVAPYSINEQVQIQHYEPYGGYRAFHAERTGFKPHMARHLVFQTYLNTVEDGGETEFFYQKFKCKAVKGRTLIWPADWTHTHRGIVSPTENKYIITGWYTFNNYEHTWN